MSTKALNLLKSKQTTSEIAEEFIGSIEKEVKNKFIDELESRIEGIQDRIADAKQFSLTTNINKGVTASTRSECKERFFTLMCLEYELKLAQKELEIKKEIFNDYFKAALIKAD